MEERNAGVFMGMLVGAYEALLPSDMIIYNGCFFVRFTLLGGLFEHFIAMVSGGVFDWISYTSSTNIFLTARTMSKPYSINYVRYLLTPDVSSNICLFEFTPST